MGRNETEAVIERLAKGLPRSAAEWQKAMRRRPELFEDLVRDMCYRGWVAPKDGPIPRPNAVQAEHRMRSLFDPAEVEDDEVLMLASHMRRGGDSAGAREVLTWCFGAERADVEMSAA